MFFTAISIAIILRNNIPLGPVCWLQQHTEVAPVASAPRNWPPKPRFLIPLPLLVLQPSPKSWFTRESQFSRTKRHVLQINYFSAWTQALRGCLLRVKRLIKGGKNSPMKGYCWPGKPPTCSPFYLSSLAKLPSELDTQNSFGHSLEKVSLQPALDACKVKWPPGDVCPEHLATPMSTP